MTATANATPLKSRLAAAPFAFPVPPEADGATAETGFEAAVVPLVVESADDPFVKKNVPAKGLPMPTPLANVVRLKLSLDASTDALTRSRAVWSKLSG